MGIDGEDLFHDRDDVGLVGVDAELCHGGIGYALGQIVVGEDVVVHVGGADGETQVADADVVGVMAKSS